MRIAILGVRPNWSVTELIRAAHPGDSVEFVPWQQLSAAVNCDGTRRDTSGGVHGPLAEFAGVPGGNFDRVLVRGMPFGSLEQVIFQMNLLARWQALGTPVINSPRSLEIAIDKYLALALLQAAGIPVPATRVCQTVDAAMQAFDDLGGDIVVKPVFGGEGRGMVRLSDAELALRCFRAIVNVGGVIYAQRFVEHGGIDRRLLVIGDEVLGMQRENPNDWRTNGSRGARCAAVTPSREELELARAAARATETVVAGVDLVRDQTGQPFILEVNGVPGWQRIATATGTDIAARLMNLVKKAAV